MQHGRRTWPNVENAMQSSKLLQIQGKWYQERKFPPKKVQNLSPKNPKTILNPFFFALLLARMHRLRVFSGAGAAHSCQRRGGAAQWPVATRCKNLQGLLEQRDF
jgi:hypothetical protein